MIIKVVCPVCKANNELTAYAMLCRRCREDLSLLYAVKGYSYKYRLFAVQLWMEKHQKESLDVADMAYGLDKS